MDLDTKKYLRELIGNNSIESNDVFKDKVKRANLVNYVDSDDNSNIEIFEGDEFDDLDYIPPDDDLTYESDDSTDISDFEITSGKRKKQVLLDIQIESFDSQAFISENHHSLQFIYSEKEPPTEKKDSDQWNEFSPRSTIHFNRFTRFRK